MTLFYTTLDQKRIYTNRVKKKKYVKSRSEHSAII